MLTISILLLVTLLAALGVSKSALLSSTSSRLEIELRDHPKYEEAINRLIKSPSRYFIVILTGELLVYAALIAIMTAAIGRLSNSDHVLWWLLAPIILLIVLLILLKSIIRSNPDHYLRIFSRPLHLLLILLYPITQLFTYISTLGFKLFGKRHKCEIVKIDRIVIPVESARASGENEANSTKNEMKILQNALDFGGLQVRNCMIPRVDIKAIEIESTIDELARLFNKTHFTRIPVYKDTIDNIVGYASSRSLFNRPKSIREILLELIYVPESGVVQKLLEQLIKSHKSMAIVIDEFGGTAGLITIEDILEEIFGEIEDEHDADYMVEKRLSENLYVFSGRLDVDYLNEKHNLQIPQSEEYETLAGLILYHNGSVPQVGETVEIGALRLKILRGSSSKISVVELETLNSSLPYKFVG